MSWFLSDALQPFSIAAAILLGLVLIEVVGLMTGSSASQAMQDPEFGELADTALGWLNLGRVPLFMLLMLLLGTFAVSGMVLQALAEPSVGTLPPLLASMFAGFIAIFATRLTSRAAARILPRDETYVLSDDDLVGRVGVVTVGPLEARFVGKVSVVDRHGNRHFPRARPSGADDVIETGASVLIVATADREYRVIRAPAELSGSGLETDSR